MPSERVPPADIAPSLRFRYGDVAGYISGGEWHGVELTGGERGGPATRSMCMNLEHYFAADREGGWFVPRFKTVRHTKLIDNGIQVDFEPYENWPVRSSIIYELLDSACISATYTFHFSDAIPAFEGFISNYFTTQDAPHVYVNGSWQQPALTDTEHRYLGRSMLDITTIRDRLNVVGSPIPDAKPDLTFDEQIYDRPIMISDVAGGQWQIIHIADPEHCPSLSYNRKWQAHDFSLIGRDVQAGETITCRAWMICTQLSSMDDAFKWYDQLLS